MVDLKGELVKQSSGALTEAYKDLVSPTAEPVGVMLSLLPRTIRLGLSKWEKWIVNGEESLKLTAQALQKKVESIPAEKQCEPEPYIAVPAIQQISYCYDSSELRDMYANLLASSMNTDKKWNVHPGFVDIIKQLTPDEAKILRVLPKTTMFYKPLVDLQVEMGNIKGQRTICRNYTNAFDTICDAPQNTSQYLENLDRLKLINIPEDQHITDDSFYQPIENSPTLQEKKTETLAEGETYKFKRKLFYVTNYGVAFITCCIYG